MSEAIAFDTHPFVKNLMASGFTEAQAEALAHEQILLLEANLATKADLSSVKADRPPEMDGGRTDCPSRGCHCGGSVSRENRVTSGLP